MNRNLAARLAKLEAVRTPRPFVLIAATPQEAERRLAEWRGGPVVIAPPVAATVEEWLEPPHGRIPPDRSHVIGDLGHAVQRFR